MNVCIYWGDCFVWTLLIWSSGGGERFATSSLDLEIGDGGEMGREVWLAIGGG